MRKAAALAASFCCIFFADAARADSAGQFLARYSAANPNGKLFFETMAGELAQGFEYANADLHQNNRPQLYCQPQKLALTGRMMIDILSRFVDTHLGAEKLDYRATALLALKVTFPCENSN